MAKLVLSLLALMLGGYGLSAQTYETRDLSFAKRSFQDGLHDLAALKLNNFIKAYPNSSQLHEAYWLLGQAYYFQDNFENALTEFSRTKNIPEDWHPRFIYWQAETYGQLKQWKKAIALFQEIIDEFAQTEWSSKSSIGLSKAHFAIGNHERAINCLKPLLESERDGVKQLAMLQEARILLAQEKWTQARPLIVSLTQAKLRPPLLFEVKLWEGEVAIINEEYSEALEAFKRITSDQRATPRRLVAQAWFNQGKVHEILEQWPKSASAYEQCFILSRSANTTESAVLKYLEIESKNGNLATAALKVKEFVRKQEIPPIFAWLAIARYHLNDKDYNLAISELDNFISSYHNHPARWNGYLLLAEALQLNNNIPKSLEVLDKIAEQNESPQLKLKAQLKMAGLKFDQNDFANASKFYQIIAKETSSLQLSETCDFRNLICLARTRKIDEFENEATIFQKKYTESEYLESIQLEHASLLEQNDQIKEARNIYFELIAKSASLPKVAEAKYALGKSYYKSSENKKAYETLEGLIEDHPSFPQREEAIYWKIFTEQHSESSDAETIRKSYEALLTDYPEHTKKVHIFFQIALSYYNEQNYNLAQKKFEQIAQDFPSNAFVHESMYLAGRSSMGLNNYQKSISLLEKVDQDSEFKPYARLAQVVCLMFQGQHEEALKITDSLIKEKANDYIWTEASLRKVDCLFQLANNSPQRLKEAHDICSKILANENANIAAKNEAGYLKGRILLEMNQQTEALEAYMDVVYGNYLPSEITQQNHEPELFWFIKSGVEAAEMKEDLNDIRGAVAIYRILEKLGGPSRIEFRHKIEDLKARHFIWEET
ncbi:MAG: tetratricopeptide repeat protein [Verrucomicrobiota bacterium]